MTELALQGCSFEPLISYLKALGILRLVAEDRTNGDPEARSSWRRRIFTLESRFDCDGLAEYFHRAYRPTPILVPWSGGDFFGVSPEGNVGPYAKTPTSTRIIEAFLASKSERLAHYRRAIQLVLEVMSQEGIDSKKAIEGGKGKERKSGLLAAIRARGDEDLVRWVDAAAVIEEDRVTFNTLLGSGGGSDGNSHYSDNFMQHLWDALPEFEEQGSTRARIEFIRSALFGERVRGLTERTPSLFSSGGVGGPNASLGFEGGSVLNSWDFILALEGTICFAGAVSRKLSSSGAMAFPFSVLLSAGGYGTAVGKESGQREIWVPVWHRPISLPELLLIFSEGRAQTGRRLSRTGADFARAVASFGVDAGIDAFQRFGFVKGRVGGENYTTSVPLGLFPVKERRQASLLLEIDDWLERFRSACRDDAGPPRFQTALRRIETAIINLGRYGGKKWMLQVLCALGNAERELACGERFRSNDLRTIPPIPTLEAQWIQACDDGSVEFRLAAALAGINGDRQAGVGELRENLEPVQRDQFGRWTWTSGSGVVWGTRDLARNLAQVLWRRVMDSQRANMAHPALWSSALAHMHDVAAFLARETDDAYTGDLIWGLMLVDHSARWQTDDVERSEVIGVPAVYAMLKLCFLPGKLRWREREFDISSDPAILGRLRAEDVQAAVKIAAQRIRIAGLSLKWKGQEDTLVGAARLSAALLIPMRNHSWLAGLVVRRAGEEIVATEEGVVN